MGIATHKGMPAASVVRRGRGSSILPHRRLTEDDLEALSKL
eukprot:NODE_4045_length_452_cov_1067.062035_g3121_i0.p3 GENE.NODE_4045_length_452_cov_1067.062035_g3121_i0~~NODE_4045_length_452_cov_1067.062035_g3121_i0.p3  ORF type:complete len:51 (+),score=29.99 NODE_4045_length_452_cov_1067.062035_g3121_i0:31-153(+)